jgi:cytochrome c5
MNTSTRSAVVLLFAVLLAGCGINERIAPPVSSATLAAASRRHIAPDALETGRRIYMVRCTECHSMRPVGEYSGGEWRPVVAKMARKAKLDDAQKQTLLDYLTATSDALNPAQR